MMPTQTYDIIIVGGGPAGMGAALHIARLAPELAKRMLILEARQYPRDKLCGGGITVHGEEQLEKLGIHIDVPAFMVDRLLFRLGEREFAVPHKEAMRVIHRSQFDAALADAASTRGLTIQTGVRLLDIHPLDGNQGGMCLKTNQGNYQATVVIAADGANSTVRRKLRFASSESTARLLRILTPVDPDKDPLWQEKSAVFDFSCIKQGIKGYTWDFPCYIDGVPHMNRGIFDSRIPPHPENTPHGNLKQTFSAWLAERDVNLDDVTLKGHPVRWFKPDAEFARPHVLLTGDAAGVDALFAEGISYALEYGEIVAQTLIEAFASSDFSFSNYRERLLQHRLGRLLQRREVAASTLYAYKLPPFWSVFWWFAHIAPAPMQRRFGAALALLPE